MFVKLFLLFTLFPLIELYILMKLGASFGVVTTLFIVVGTGIMGAVIARGEGYKALFKLQQDMREGRMPARGMLDLILIFFAGIVLIVPGILTDIMGLVILLPVVRELLIDYILNKIRNNIMYRNSVKINDDIYDDEDNEV